jgi:pyruvate formate lyase activating enzyme
MPKSPSASVILTPMQTAPAQPPTGYIWDIKRYAIHDGPGIRTTVFMLGCPLKCLWCCNPESQSFTPRMLWLGEICLSCGLCSKVCPGEAIEVDKDGERRIDHLACDQCGLCADTCPVGAMTLTGRKVSVEQVLAEVMRDEAFFNRSNGGLTISGGEPLAQPEFLLKLARRYKKKEKGLNLALETSGQGSLELLLALTSYVDVFLFDIKNMDSETHHRLTGRGNRDILENLRGLAGAGANIVVRLPLIPNYNDSNYNVKKTAIFAKSLSSVSRLDLLPYHRLGEPKYDRLGLPYALSGTKPHSKKRIAELVELVRGQGLEVRLGG